MLNKNGKLPCNSANSSNLSKFICDLNRMDWVS